MGSWMSLCVRVRVRVRVCVCARACMLMFTHLWAVVFTCLSRHSSAKSFLSARSNTLHLNRRVDGWVGEVPGYSCAQITRPSACAVLRNSADKQSRTTTRTSERTCAHFYTHTSQSVQSDRRAGRERRVFKQAIFLQLFPSFFPFCACRIREKPLPKDANQKESTRRQTL